MKGDIGIATAFLDVMMKLVNGVIETTVFIKPTDSQRYLSRRSDHSLHVFKGIPFSQFRRAVVICSNDIKKMESINYMFEKFHRSGYDVEELNRCKQKALDLNRDEILANHSHRNDGLQKLDKDKLITFVINHDPTMATHLKTFFIENSDLLKRIIGNQKIIISERKSPNMASLTFAKTSFSLEIKARNLDQKCGTKKCLTCPLMNLPTQLTLNKVPVKLDFSLNCMDENCIYVAICKICKFEFYLGKTFNMARTRFCGH